MISSIAIILDSFFKLLELAILVDIVASWIPQIQGNKFVVMIHSFIYPLLEPFRRLQDRIMPNLPIDFSPILLLIVLDIFKDIIF